MLLIAASIGVILLLILITCVLIRPVLNGPWSTSIPPAVLATMTFLAIIAVMVVCFVAFFKGRHDARRSNERQDFPLESTLQPYPEHTVVRISVDKVDDRKRPVKAGAIGTIVHVHPRAPLDSQAYMIEVVLTDKQGVQKDAHLFDARHDELELCAPPGDKKVPSVSDPQ